MALLTHYDAPRAGLWPGCACVGELEVDSGAVLPVYDTEPPKDKPSINTLEGWNALAERQRNENRLHA